MNNVNYYNSCALPIDIFNVVRKNKNNILPYGINNYFKLTSNKIIKEYSENLEQTEKIEDKIQTDQKEEIEKLGEIKELQDEKLSFISSILHKILIRGKITLVSEYEEDLIAKYIGINTKQIDYSKVDINNLSNNLNKLSLMISTLHKIEVAIVEGLYYGIVNFNDRPEIGINIKGTDLLSEDLNFIINTVLKENFGTLFDYLSMSYGYGKYFGDIAIYECEDYNTINGLIIYDGEDKNIENSIHISEYDFLSKKDDKQINEFLKIPENTTNLRFNKDIDEEILNFFLTYIFRKKSFREGQFESIKNILIGKDTLVLLPTGSGKSIIFQLAGLLIPGTIIIICPLISLIEDQMDNLLRNGIDNVIGIINTNGSNKRKALNDLEKGNPIFVYVSPEKFLTKDFRDVIENYKKDKQLSMVVIDEAHCCSEWGHDFRTSYLNIGKIARRVCSNKNLGGVIFTALTGTASNAVLKDMQRELMITDYRCVITPKTFERKELDFRIITCNSKDKFNVLKDILENQLPELFNKQKEDLYSLKGNDTLGGVIFCPHTSGEFGVDYISRKINELGINANSYGGKKPDGLSEKDWEDYKINITSRFKDNEYPILVATKGFGMGIDKPNIRYTIHYGLPNSMESFYQEAGRSGRDGGQARNFLIISNNDLERTEKLLNLSTSPSDINGILQKTNMNKADDLTRALWFHYQSFKGINEELKYSEVILSSIGELNSEDFILKVNNHDKVGFDKGIQRLLILGIIDDYTFDYFKNEFTFVKGNGNISAFIENYLDYVKSYNPAKYNAEKIKTDKIEKLDIGLSDKLVLLTTILIKFVYDTIEKGRRRAIKETLSLSDCKKSEEVSSKIIKYLEGSKNDLLDRVVNDKDIKFLVIKDIIDGFDEDGMSFGGIVSTKEAEKMKGYISRYLEGYPDNPQLLILRGIMEAFSRDIKISNIIEDLTLGVKFSKTKYGINNDVIYNSIIWSIIKMNSLINGLNNSISNDIIVKLIDDIGDIMFVRSLIISDMNDDLLEYPYYYYFGTMGSHFEKIINLKQNNQF